MARLHNNAYIPHGTTRCPNCGAWLSISKSLGSAQKASCFRPECGWWGWVMTTINGVGASGETE